MNLAVFLSLGESFSDLKKSGQDQLMINQNLAAFTKAFEQVYVFTYKQEKVKLPKNCTLITPPKKLHRYIYAFLFPFIHRKTLKQCHLIRAFQLSGSLPAIVARIFFNKKYVFNLGYDYAKFAAIEKKPIQALMYKILKPIASILAAKVIVKNKSLKSPKSIYIPNGVDTSKFKPKKRKIKSGPDGPHLLFIGRLEPQKNILNLLRAVSLLKTKVNLTLIGRGSQKNQIKKLAQKLKLKYKLINSVPHQKLSKLYHQADFFCLPSLKEGSPKVLLEAMSSGLPCVASKIPEHLSIISHRHNGLLSATDSKSLSRSLSNLLNSQSLAKKLGQNARQTIIHNFNQEKLIKQEVTLLKNEA